jgi:sialate O-acetylesterase
MKKMCILFGILFAINVNAEMKMPNMFSDNMVLQRDIPLPVWGWAEPGDTITVEFAPSTWQTGQGGQRKMAVAGKDGRWTAVLDPLKLSSEPMTMTVSSQSLNRPISKSPNTEISRSQNLQITNILVGDVWLCSGQSNMGCNFGDPQNTDEKVKDVDIPQIRLSNGGKWSQCNTANLQPFSRVGYYFGLKLWKELQVPIGLINISQGCSSIETWMTPESLAANDSLIDINGCKLFSEMKKFQQFYSNYKQSSAEEKERVFLEHCKSKYIFARGYLQNGKPMLDKYDSILWHMTVVKPAFLYNSRIVPVIPFGIRGVIWYQGETNIADKQYALKLQILIEGWRRLWGEGDFPFHIVQLAPCKDGKDSPSPLPDFWMQQYEAARKTSNTGLSSAVDIGDSNEYHPKNKRDVGLRLALLALRDTYGRKDIVASGPTYKSIKVDGSKVVVEFDNLGTGLTTKDGQVPNWFEVAGTDKKFVKAKVAIDGNTVVVSSPMASPAYVRYGWSCVADPNLRNKEGLPAFPFNTAEPFFQNIK